MFIELILSLFIFIMFIGLIMVGLYYGVGSFKTAINNAVGQITNPITGAIGNVTKPIDNLIENITKPIDTVSKGINNLANSVPMVCPYDKVNYAGLCYSVGAGQEVKSPGIIGPICPSGSNWNGTSCYYDRGVGTIPIKQPCSAGERDDGLSCWLDDHTYGNYCKPGYQCPEGYTNTGCFCQRYAKITKALWDRQECGADRELIGGLCYKKPLNGFNCFVTACSSGTPTAQIGTVPDTCPSGSTKQGLLCVKN